VRDTATPSSLDSAGAISGVASIAGGGGQTDRVEAAGAVPLGTTSRRGEFRALPAWRRPGGFVPAPMPGPTGAATLGGGVVASRGSHPASGAAVARSGGGLAVPPEAGSQTVALSDGTRITFSDARKVLELEPA
jgi:hypothetical protein